MTLRNKPTDKVSSCVQEIPSERFAKTAIESSFRDFEDIRLGFSFKHFLDLQDQLGVSAAALAEVLGIAPRTLQRRREDGRFAKDESDRIERLERLISLANDVLGDTRSARSWLLRPQMALSGLVPFEMADTGPGVRAIERLLGQLDYGVYV